MECLPLCGLFWLRDQLIGFDTLTPMYGMGTNMGIKRMAGVDPRITAEDLRYTRRRYLHKEHMRAAIAQVVNALLRARLESIWGAATSACASDSKKYHAVYLECMVVSQMSHSGGLHAIAVQVSSSTGMWNAARRAFIRSSNPAPLPR